jgi:rhodanese-related sulfurtransferase
VTAAPTARIIDVATLRSRLEEDPPRILDVRTLAEFETAHIPGSYNVPLDLLREHRDELARHIDEDVVLVCRSGARASQAEQALGQAGLVGLRVLDGGMNSWQRAGAPVNRGRQTWDLERQVRLAAGSVVAASDAGGGGEGGGHPDGGKQPEGAGDASGQQRADGEAAVAP